ncbi:MAG: ADP-ribosylation factor-like protein, partial [Promethearchaeota archaeon]
MLNEKSEIIKENSIVKGIVFSQFIDEDGPTPLFSNPSTISKADQMNIAMKSISLLMGESIYQAGYDLKNITYFGIIPFPELKKYGFIYFFLIPDERVRGKAKAATITILVDETHQRILYDYQKSLKILMQKTAGQIKADSTKEDFETIFNQFIEELNVVFEKEKLIILPKKYKIVFMGLPKAGKKSLSNEIIRLYYEFLNLSPLRYIKKEHILKILNMDFAIWNIKENETFRQDFFKNAAKYLKNADLLFYIIDVQDPKRLEENINYLSHIIDILDELNENPTINILFNKFDEDHKSNPETLKYIELIKEELKKNLPRREFNYFTTSIEDKWSILNAFTTSRFLLNPNREIYRRLIKTFLNKIKGSFIFLISGNGTILSDYSKVENPAHLIELTYDKFYQLLSNLIKNDLNLVEDNFIHFRIGDLNLGFKKLVINPNEMLNPQRQSARLKRSKNRIEIQLEKDILLKSKEIFVLFDFESDEVNIKK